ncbi:transcriptional regulator, GntR family [Seinonella peptonophila]|uniref:Transcriptional regulator, GntR family n=1 Tax=Seinonella peptonophila TaxID=112248 RepID=A0A1M4VK48_9BACL|nr:GntR family transcriptional regulator [Seinonella peptonophila]SHE69203.1 transcriptional regulator, GntR family [Seinonella peptonophila]
MSDLNLQPIEKEETTKERAYKRVKEAILSGKLSYESLFTEVGMAKTLQISRTPVREALQELQKEGLIIAVPRKGLMVKRVSQHEVEEVFLLRHSIECEVISRLAKQLSHEQLTTLEQICHEQEDAMEKKDGGRFISLDQIFHITLTRLGSYQLVEQVLVNLHDLSQLIGLQAVKREQRMGEVITEHRLIIQALAAQDQTKAVAMMSNHLLKTKEALHIE